MFHHNNYITARFYISISTINNPITYVLIKRFRYATLSPRLRYDSPSLYRHRHPSQTPCSVHILNDTQIPSYIVLANIKLLFYSLIFSLFDFC